jgi:hypothetical protein
MLGVAGFIGCVLQNTSVKFSLIFSIWKMWILRFSVTRYVDNLMFVFNWQHRKESCVEKNKCSYGFFPADCIDRTDGFAFSYFASFLPFSLSTVVEIVLSVKNSQMSEFVVLENFSLPSTVLLTLSHHRNSPSLFFQDENLFTTW